MLTVTDKRTPVPVSGNPTQVASYEADVISSADYSPFGMTLPARVYNHHWNKYRYGFNGKEVNKEVYGPYNELDYGFRIYDPRLGRFLSIDPLTRDFPSLTPYQYASNSPIENSDLDGLESINRTQEANNRRWAAQIEVKTSAELRNSRLVQAMMSSQYQSPIFQVGNTPTYSPEQKEIKDAQFRAVLRNNGYNDDGSKPPMMRIAENKTFNRLAENIILPTLEVASYAGAIGEIKALHKGLTSVRFFSVQNNTDKARLLAGGNPWPTDPLRAHLGEGLYAWGSKSDAEKYLAQKISRNPDVNFNIMEFSIPKAEYRKLNSYVIPENNAGDLFLQKHSRIYGEGVPHDYDYIIGNTNIGKEHYFREAIYKLLKPKK